MPVSTSATMDAPEGAVSATVDAPDSSAPEVTTANAPGAAVVDGEECGEPLVTKAQLTAMKVADLKKMLAELKKRKDHRGGINTGTKTQLVEQILKVQSKPDPQVSTDIIPLSTAEETARLQKEVQEVQAKSLSDGTVRDRIRKYNKLVEWLRTRHPCCVVEIVCDEVVPDLSVGADSGASEADDGSQQKKQYMIRPDKLTADIFTQFLQWLEIEPRWWKTWQKDAYDLAPEGRKPKFYPAVGTLKAYRTVVKQVVYCMCTCLGPAVGGLLRNNTCVPTSTHHCFFFHLLRQFAKYVPGPNNTVYEYPTHWDEAVKKFLSGQSKIQAEEKKVVCAHQTNPILSWRILSSRRP